MIDLSWWRQTYGMNRRNNISYQNFLAESKPERFKLLFVKSWMKVLHPLFMRIVTRLMATEKAVSSSDIESRLHIFLQKTAEIIFKCWWKPELMNVMAESAAARDVKQLNERHITVLLIQCAALRRPFSKWKTRVSKYNKCCIHLSVRRSTY